MSVGVLAEAGEGYSPPGAGDFVLPGIFEGVEWLNKPVLMASVSVIVLICFFYLASRKGALVPGRLQFIGEGAYGFVRKDLGRDILGTDNFMKFIPLIFSLFIFIALNNVFGIVPFIQFPTMSRIGFPIALTLIVWVVYNYVGIQHQGFVGYFKNMMFPAGRTVVGLRHPGSARVRLDAVRAPPHARTATVRQHVRRAPAAAGVHPRWRVHARREHQPAARRSCRSDRHRHGHRDDVLRSR